MVSSHYRSSGSSSPHVFGSEPTLAECLEVVKDAKDELVELTGTPRQFAQRTLAEYVASLSNEDGEDGDLTIFDRAIARVQQIHAKAHCGQDAIYVRCGVCPEWQASDQVCRSIRLVIAFLEGIYCIAMEGTCALAEADFLDQLVFKRGNF